jgi:hypothetical protein
VIALSFFLFFVLAGVVAPHEQSPGRPSQEGAQWEPSCTWTDFVGKDRVRRVCGSQDRVRLVRTDEHGSEPLCHEHAIPFTYEKTFEDRVAEELIAHIGGDSPRARRVRELRDEALRLRILFMMDQRRTRLLQEEELLREEADQLEEELLLEYEEAAEA